MHFGKQRRVRIATRQCEPHLAHSHANPRPDFQQREPNRRALCSCEGGARKAKMAQRGEQQVRDRVRDPGRRATVVEACGKLAQDAGRPIHLAQQHRAAVRGHRAAIEPRHYVVPSGNPLSRHANVDPRFRDDDAGERIPLPR